MGFLNSSSVETMPDYESHAAFSANSTSVFKEDTYNIRENIIVTFDVFLIFIATFASRRVTMIATRTRT